MKNIHIPDPCPEKWSDMTPTEKGAMCSKCATEVLDFTQLTNDEIKEVLKKAAGKRVCAKMSSDQEQKPEFPPTLIAQTGMTGFRNRLLYAMVLVFGVSFLGCKPVTPHKVGKVAPVEHKIGDVQNDDTDEPEERQVKGKVKYDPDDE